MRRQIYYADIAIPSRRQSTPGTLNVHIEERFYFLSRAARDRFAFQFRTPRKFSSRSVPYTSGRGRLPIDGPLKSLRRMANLIKMETI